MVLNFRTERSIKLYAMQRKSGRTRKKNWTLQKETYERTTTPLCLRADTWKQARGTQETPRTATRHTDGGVFTTKGLSTNMGFSTTTGGGIIA